MMTRESVILARLLASRRRQASQRSERSLCTGVREEWWKSSIAQPYLFRPTHRWCQTARWCHDGEQWDRPVMLKRVELVGQNAVLPNRDTSESPAKNNCSPASRFLGPCQAPGQSRATIVAIGRCRGEVRRPPSRHRLAPSSLIV